MMSSLLLDSNIIIYAMQPDDGALRPLLGAHNRLVASVTLIEVLGYRGLSEEDERAIRAFFAMTAIIPLDGRVVEQAVQIRQRRSIRTPDAIIAATALTQGVPLCTRNVADFHWIDGLQIVNPFQ